MVLFSFYLVLQFWYARLGSTQALRLHKGTAPVCRVLTGAQEAMNERVSSYELVS